MLSKRGAHFIGRYEGWRTSPYNDAASNATIGYGHLIHYGRVTATDVREWGVITQDHGIELLRRDASVAENAVAHYTTRPLAECERDALISFCFNVGGGGLAGTGVQRAVNARQDPTSEMLRWDNAGGHVMQGLLTRRKAEAHLFLTGDYCDGSPPAPPHPYPPPHPTPPPLPHAVPDWAWKWVEWKLGRATFKGHASVPKLRAKTGAPAKIPPWGWTFLHRFL